MSKKTTLQRPQERELAELNFEEMIMGDPEEETMLEALSTLAEIDRHQTQISMELTKLIVENRSEGKLKEKDILSLFKKSKQMVSSCCPLQEVLQNISS